MRCVQRRACPRPLNLNLPPSDSANQLLLSLDTEFPFAKGDPVFSILPLHITVSCLRESKGLEPGCGCESSHPLHCGYVDSVWSGITDHEANVGRRLTHSSQRQPDTGEIQEVACDHVVVCFLAASGLPYLSKLFADRSKLAYYRAQFWFFKYRVQIDRPVRHMLGARAYQVAPGVVLQVAPSLNLAKESQLEPRSIGIIVVVGIGRRRHY